MTLTYLLMLMALFCLAVRALNISALKHWSWGWGGLLFWLASEVVRSGVTLLK